MNLPQLHPAELLLLAVLGMAGSGVACYGSLLVLGWAYNLPLGKHARVGSVEDVLPVRGRWLSCLVMVAVTLVAGSILLLSIALFLICLNVLLSQIAALPRTLSW